MAEILALMIPVALITRDFQAFLEEEVVRLIISPCRVVLLFFCSVSLRHDCVADTTGITQAFAGCERLQSLFR